MLLPALLAVDTISRRLPLLAPPYHYCSLDTSSDHKHYFCLSFLHAFQSNATIASSLSSNQPIVCHSPTHTHSSTTAPNPTVKSPLTIKAIAPSKVSTTFHPIHPLPSPSVIPPIPHPYSLNMVSYPMIVPPSSARPFISIVKSRTWGMITKIC